MNQAKPASANTTTGLIAKLHSPEYREAFVESQIRITIPFQIRALRRQRGWSQEELAEKAGMRQPRISAMERAGGGHLNIETLIRLATAFDVALVVRFASFSELVNWSEAFDPEGFWLPSFNQDIRVRETVALATNTAAFFRSESCWALQGACPETLVDAVAPTPVVRHALSPLKTWEHQAPPPAYPVIESRTGPGPAIA